MKKNISDLSYRRRAVSMPFNGLKATCLAWIPPYGGMTPLPIIITVLFTSLITGCDLAPDYSAPEIKTPSEWKNGEQKTDVEKLSDEKFWQQFGSTELSTLIAKATAENNDLLAAAARVEQAQASAKIAGSSLLPNISASGNANRNFSNKPKKASNSYQAGVQLAYEADVFGKLRDAANSADYNAIASDYDREALRLSISAQVAEGYFNLLALNQRVGLAENNLKNAQDILKIIQNRFDAGAVSQLELSQQKTLVANEESSLANLKQQREVSQNSLAVLLGETPENFTIKETDLNALTAPQLTKILPAELLTHRPDIASLEAQMRAANFDIGAARAAFLPSINLNASSALAANPASAAAATIFALASSITIPLFTAGQLEGGLEKATARQQELAANYRKAILTAYGEAENALSNIQNTQAQFASLTTAAGEAKKSADIATTKFKVGATDYQSLLTTQNTLLQTQDALAQASSAQLSASVELFKALGGGFGKN